MLVEVLAFLAVILGMLLGFAAVAYAALSPLRSLLRLGPQGRVDLFVSVVFAVFLFLMLVVYPNARTTLSWVALLALPLSLAGLLFVGVGVFEAPKRTDRGERRDRLIVGTALMATAFVIVALSAKQYPGLFSNVASSVSNAPEP